MFKPCYGVISLESQDQAKTGLWDRVTSQGKFPDLAHQLKFESFPSPSAFPKMARVTWLNAIIHSWSRTFPAISLFMGATIGQLTNKLIQRVVLNVWKDLCKKYWVFDNIWGQDLQHTYSFCLSFGLKAHERRIRRLYSLVNLDWIVHRAKE
jgi:hypothetical protein